MVTVDGLRPANLGVRGAALWSAMVGDSTSTDRQVMIGEACRLADRLDRLDALIQGDADVWARLIHRVQTNDYELRIDAAVGEARMTASALKQILLALNEKPASDQTPGGGTLAEQLAALRAARASDTAS